MDRVFAAVVVGLVGAACGGAPSPAVDGGATPDSSTPADAGVPELAGDVVNACAFIQLCGFSTYPEWLAANVPGCVQAVLQARMTGVASPEMRPAGDSPEMRYLEQIVDCGGSATTCDEFRQCVHGGTILTCASPVDDRCDGETAIDCRHSTDAFPTVRRCGDLGMVCVGGVACVPPAAGACSSPTEPACTGDTVEYCDGTSLRRADCAAVGRTCFDPPDGDGLAAAFCALPGTAACTAPAPATCDGETLLFCNWDGVSGLTAQMDCAAGGRTCTTMGGCVRTASECDEPPATWTGACDGDAAVLCVEHRRIRIPCATVGRTTCTMSGAQVGCE